jgi:hypothetical protein
VQSQSLADLIAGLSSKQRAAVEEFIRYLKQQSAQPSATDFRDALDSFVREHPELLQRLAR